MVKLNIVKYRDSTFTWIKQHYLNIVLHYYYYILNVMSYCNLKIQLCVIKHELGYVDTMLWRNTYSSVKLSAEDREWIISDR